MIDKIRKLLERAKRPFLVWLVVVALCGVVGGVVANCADASDDIVDRPMQNNSRITCVIVEFVDADLNRSEAVFDFPAIYNDIDYKYVSESIASTAENPKKTYSMYFAKTFGGAMGEDSRLVAGYWIFTGQYYPGEEYVENLKIKSVTIRQENVYLHNYTKSTRYPYSGAGGNTIQLPGGVNAHVTVSGEIQSSVRLQYTGKSSDSALDYKYDGIRFGTSRYIREYDYIGGEYVQIGETYAGLQERSLAISGEPSVVLNRRIVYQDGYKVGMYEEESGYRFGYMPWCETRIEFETAGNYDLWYTDVFTSDNDRPGLLYPDAEVERLGQPEVEVGSFLRDSIDAFMEFDIIDGFTLRDLFWVVLAAFVVIGALLIFGGR